MQSKWRAPACYVGVALVCALYLSIVPGVGFADVCAGAGIGAALMWAINEWEAGKWTVRLVQPAVAGAAAASPAEVQPALASPAPAQVAPHAQPVAQAVSAAPQAPVRPQPPTQAEDWEIDAKEPSWDPSALAETWAKLRNELSINGSTRKPAVAPDLPRTAQLAKTSQIAAGSQLAKAQLTGLAARSAGAPATAPAGTSAKPSLPTPSSAKPSPAKPSPAKPSYGGQVAQASQPPAHSSTARKAVGGTEAPVTRPAPMPNFLRPSASRPR